MKVAIDPEELARVRAERDAQHERMLVETGLKGAIAIRRDDFMGDVTMIVDDATVVADRVMAVRGFQMNQDGTPGKRRWVAGPGRFEIVRYAAKHD